MPARSDSSTAADRSSVTISPTARPSLQTDASAPPYEAPCIEQPIKVVNLRTLEQQAAKVLPEFGFHFIAGGSGDEWTLRENEMAFDRLTIEPRYLPGVASADLRTTILGSAVSAPIITAPMGLQGLAHSSKEVGSARGTIAAGGLYVTTSVSTLSLEEIASACEAGPKWFQIYVPEDRDYAREQLQRAKQAGYTAIVLTVDATTYGNRERAAMLGLRAPPRLEFGNTPISPALAGRTPDMHKTALDWGDVAFCVAETGLPLVLKGVMTPALARDAVRHGCAGIWVSNHGGRQLDHLAGSISVLPRIVDAVDGKVPIIIDGGIRRGHDVFSAIALGASVVAIGRPVLYGLALGGAKGVEAVYARLRAELAMTMQLAGAGSIADITPDFVSRAST
ncbi:alpha-hydroxy acid oxidase [Rhodoplanes roseus]|uniref:alpha-hydroxy acid oxidase n=1 Tax=Rhodoplanes roseus TaxID=29409 RepID=UPI00315E0099